MHVNNINYHNNVRHNVNIIMKFKLTKGKQLFEIKSNFLTNLKTKNVYIEINL